MPVAGAPKTFRWIHFSDLHVGSPHNADLWPRFKTLLFDDLKRGIGKHGPVDLVLFSGDLAQKGTATEFGLLTERLEEILGVLGELQEAPKLVTVPGNHDLVRPSSMVAEGVALRQFWNDEAIREGLWSSEGASYLQFIARLFGSYNEWRSSQIAKGWHLAAEQDGLLPGDASYTLQVGDGTLGIVGLNSAWLQLGPDDYEGFLHVDVRQLLAVTEGSPDDWVRSRDANLLVTHHPASWLKANKLASWPNDISPAGRFDLHAFGHMHQPLGKALVLGGGFHELTVQAPSLFGLEQIGDNETQRIQGYSFAQIAVQKDDRRLTVWPRILKETAGRKMKIVPDHSQDIDEDTQSYEMSYVVDKGVISCTRHQIEVAPDTVVPEVPVAAIGLETFQYDVGDSSSHRRARKLEQESALAILKEQRSLFLIADWGMGQDAFIAILRDTLKIQQEKVFSFDFAEYRSREEFIDSFKSKHGITFELICEKIADEGPSIIIFRDVDLSDAAGVSIPDIRDLVQTISDFADEAYVIVHARKGPERADEQLVELHALDEADLALYVADSELGEERYSRPDAVSALYRHTDGVPSNLDDALRNLKVMSLNDLIESNPDLSGTGSLAVQTPTALVSAISALANTEDRDEGRAYELLRALSALPQGERLSRIRRFLGVHPFGPRHAQALFERALVDAVVVPNFEMQDDVDEKVLMVPRVVREFVRTQTADSEAKVLDGKALELYFGPQWQSGFIESSPTGRRVSKALCDPYEIQNSSTLVYRNLRRAVDSANELDVEAGIRLASSFVAILINGDHFRAAAALCDDVLRTLTELSGRDKELSILRAQLGRCLRMIGRKDEAKSVLETVEFHHLPKGQRQVAYLEMAFLLDAKEPQVAADWATKAIALASKSVVALNAKTILAGQIADEAARLAEYRGLLEEARKKKAEVVGNNIKLEIARLERKHGSADRSSLREVMREGKLKGDYYNSTRAIIDLASQDDAENWLTAEEKLRLIEAYHYLYNERLPSLFDRCHAALWKVFVYDNDKENLLNLFRRSSFIWRLSGKASKEKDYLQKLLDLMKGANRTTVRGATRDGAYFIIRVSVVFTDGSASDATLDTG